MALTPDFSVSQTLGSPSVFTIEDTSTGTDSDVDSRQVFLRKYDGSYLVPDDVEEDYIEWPYEESELEIDALDKDYALRVLVYWLDAAGEVLYQKAYYLGFTQYNEDFDYSLTQAQSANHALAGINRFMELRSNLRTDIDSGDKAVTRASDLAGAQLCYDRATAIRLKADSLFSGAFN